MHPGTLSCRMQDADASGTVIDAGRILGVGCRVLDPAGCRALTHLQTVDNIHAGLIHKGHIWEQLAIFMKDASGNNWRYS